MGKEQEHNSAKEKKTEISSIRLVWYGHLKRMEETRWSKRLWQWKENGEGHQGPESKI